MKTVIHYLTSYNSKPVWFLFFSETQKGDILKNFFVHTMKVSRFITKTALDSHFMDKKERQKEKGKNKGLEQDESE